MFIISFSVVTDGNSKYFASRCIQVLISALPHEIRLEGAMLDKNDISQLRLRHAHQLILKTCRDLHLHPSESLTEDCLLALQVSLKQFLFMDELHTHTNFI